jgi:hypothetical protein
MPSSVLPVFVPLIVLSPPQTDSNYISLTCVLPQAFCDEGNLTDRSLMSQQVCNNLPVRSPRRNLAYNECTTALRRIIPRLPTAEKQNKHHCERESRKLQAKGEPMCSTAKSADLIGSDFVTGSAKFLAKFGVIRWQVPMFTV